MKIMECLGGPHPIGEGGLNCSICSSLISLIEVNGLDRDEAIQTMVRARARQLSEIEEQIAQLLKKKQ